MVKHMLETHEEKQNVKFNAAKLHEQRRETADDKDSRRWVGT